MNNISVYGAGHLAKSFFTGLGKVTDVTISVFNRTESKINDIKSVYKNLKVESNVSDLIRDRTFLFCIIPASALINLDSAVIEKIKQTDSVLISCVNGLSLEKLNKKLGDIKIIRLLPNVNWQICEGVSLFDCNDKVTDEELNYFNEILSPITKLYRVNGDTDFNRAGTLTTCSPGLFCTMLDYYFEYFDIEKLEEKEMFYEALKGTIDYILYSKKDPKAISSEVANKGGLTEVGIKSIHEQFPSCMEVISRNMKNKIKERDKMW